MTFGRQNDSIGGRGGISRRGYGNFGRQNHSRGGRGGISRRGNGNFGRQNGSIGRKGGISRRGNLDQGNLASLDGTTVQKLMKLIWLKKNRMFRMQF